MIGIFSRWRQLGRRYFWPHLLLGMVAASLGLPVANAQPPESGPVSGKSANTLFVGNAVRFEHLIRLRETARRPGVSADYWHQHAIRVVIRHLSFSLPQMQPQVRHQLLPLAAQKLAVLQSLHALLTNHHPVSQYQAAERALTSVQQPGFNSGLWLSGVQGIRAGPPVSEI